MATIDSSGQNLSDEQNLLNEVHLVIAFIGNPTWIKERKEGTYLLQSACQQLSLQLCRKKKFTSVVSPTSGQVPAAAARPLSLQDGGLIT